MNGQSFLPGTTAGIPEETTLGKMLAWPGDVLDYFFGWMGPQPHRAPVYRPTLGGTAVDVPTTPATGWFERVMGSVGRGIGVGTSAVVTPLLPALILLVVLGFIALRLGR